MGQQTMWCEKLRFKKKLELGQKCQNRIDMLINAFQNKNRTNYKIDKIIKTAKFYCLKCIFRQRGIEIDYKIRNKV